MLPKPFQTYRTSLLLVSIVLIVTIVYWPGLYGGWLFDDYPNIVDNKGVQPTSLDLPSIVRVALSSPSSEFKRPLASLSFALNYYAAGLDPYWMKLANLVVHLLNGLLAFFLTRSLLRCSSRWSARAVHAPSNTDAFCSENSFAIAALCVSSAWLLLPINLTAVLYVVQRMESMANLFVFAGLAGYVASRERMLTSPRTGAFSAAFLSCLVSIIAPIAIGLLAKETAVMLPVYALLVEWNVFGFRQQPEIAPAGTTDRKRYDSRIVGLFLATLVVPFALGMTFLLPHILEATNWSTRDFTMGTRLLSEARIVVDYIGWTLLPTPGALSFYHDDFVVSKGLVTPWTTLGSLICIVALALLSVFLRRRRPMAALGIAFFLAAHLLTATILPLELIYEHRNYFASFGLLLAVVPLLTARADAPARDASPDTDLFGTNTFAPIKAKLFRLRYRELLLGGLMIWWPVQTGMTAYAWGEPLRLAQALAARAPESPRAQYELGRTYIIYSHYDPASPFTARAYAPLERAASMPKSSILPQQALLFMNSRMHLPLKEAWWTTMIARLGTSKPGVQDESSLIALAQCQRNHQCDFPLNRMSAVFHAALSHPAPSARLLAAYGDYGWNVLKDKELGLKMAREAAEAAPAEPAYRVTLTRMLNTQGDYTEARKQIAALSRLNVGGRLDDELQSLNSLIDASELKGAKPL